jgi:hypothetical protein
MPVKAVQTTINHIGSSPRSNMMLDRMFNAGQSLLA